VLAVPAAGGEQQWSWAVGRNDPDRRGVACSGEGRLRAGRGRTDQRAGVRHPALEIESPGYALYGIQLGFSLIEGAMLEQAGQNLTNKYYLDHLNSIDASTRTRVGELGRTVSMALRWEF
jgi:outer membrane receptor protein involved in Fe transport